MSHHTKHAHKHSTRQRPTAEHRGAAHEQPSDHRPEEGAEERRPTAGVVHRDGGRTVTVTIPVDTIAGVAVEAVKLPITAAQRILPAKGGLPLYLGVGALGVAGVLEWPVAAGIGIGYAVLRKGGDLRPPPRRAVDSG
ncbi:MULTISPECIES: hypothetical protein [Streptomyces]|uniref:hypothetical protein n=1 Tax=Streptomyces TaxID=1883 RepID=UPI00163CBA29|nr:MULTISPECIES: hypothetical protein [Streptomyces]MBC2876324.1 hypothetical protein [Streptomyces sp. TYQ1024]UBI35459.1 hypothetical protein K7I03_02570 [Streptomyces mobaraensis]UKW28051.1 hypothetical protein MCU78_02600 [Streptomyces sp. TYQ1024]